MVEGLIAGSKPDEIAALGRGKVRAAWTENYRVVLDMDYDHCVGLTLTASRPVLGSLWFHVGKLDSVTSLERTSKDGGAERVYGLQ
jgi:hypothetical protein